MLGYEFGSGPDKPFLHVDFSQILEINGGLATAKLQDHYTPSQIGDSNDLFGFDFFYVNLPSINVSQDANELVFEWKTIEKQGMPLSAMTQCFVALDIIRLLANKFILVAPAWVNLPQLVTLTNRILSSGLATNFTKRMRFWAKRLQREAGLALSVLGQLQFIERVNQVEVSLVSCVAELRVMEKMIDQGYAIEIIDSGAEFLVQIGRPIKVEVKARLKKLPQDLQEKAIGDRSALEYLINPQGYLVVLSLLLIDRFPEAFDKQGCDILFQDISRTFLGWLLIASSHLWNRDLCFGEAIKDSLETVSKGKQAVIAFSYAIGPSGYIAALSLTRNDIEQFAERAREILRALKKKPDAQALVDVFSHLLQPDQEK